MSSVLTTPAGYWYVAFSWTFKPNAAQATRSQRQALAGRCHWGHRRGPGPHLRVNFSLRLLAGPRMLPTAATAAGSLAARRRPARRDSGRVRLGHAHAAASECRLSTPIWHCQWGRKAKAGPRSRANRTLDRPAIGVVRSCTASTESHLSDSESQARAGPSAGYYRPA
jgi:hypothetical protein